MDRSFPKTARLRRRREFRRVYDTGAPQRNAGFHLFVSPSFDGPDSPTRIGITVTRAAGNAVTRNRLRRWGREFFRHVRHSIPPGRDVVVNIHGRMAKADHEEFDHLLAHVFSKAHLLES